MRQIILILSLLLGACAKEGAIDSPASLSPTPPPYSQVFTNGGHYAPVYPGHYIYQDDNGSYFQDTAIPSPCIGLSILNAFQISDDGHTAVGMPSDYTVMSAEETEVHYSNQIFTILTNYIPQAGASVRWSSIRLVNTDVVIQYSSTCRVVYTIN